MHQCRELSIYHSIQARTLNRLTEAERYAWLYCYYCRRDLEPVGFTLGQLTDIRRFIETALAKIRSKPKTKDSHRSVEASQRILRITCWRIGLGVDHAWTNEEVGRYEGVCQNRIAQITRYGLCMIAWGVKKMIEANRTETLRFEIAKNP
jgi:hypothetical protein